MTGWFENAECSYYRGYPNLRKSTLVWRAFPVGINSSEWGFIDKKRLDERLPLWFRRLIPLVDGLSNHWQTALQL